jgi:hypothetical protein
MKTYVVTLIYPSPLIGTERHEVEAGSVELALAKAKRLTKVRGCSGTVRAAPATDTYHPPAAVCTNWALWGTLPALKEHA